MHVHANIVAGTAMGKFLKFAWLFHAPSLPTDLSVIMRSWRLMYYIDNTFTHNAQHMYTHNTSTQLTCTHSTHTDETEKAKITPEVR